MRLSFFQILPSRWLGIASGILCFAAWDAGWASAQQAEIVPLPQPADQSVEASGADYLSEEEYDVLLRGPVHEAFADPVGVDADAELIAPIPPPEAIQEQPPEVQPAGKKHHLDPWLLELG